MSLQNILLISLLTSIIIIIFNKKKEFNIINDIIIPINMICSTWAFVFLLNIALLEKILIILLNNKIILTPVLKLYSRRSLWLSSLRINSQIYLNIINALYYPLIWIIFLLTLRYIRLGNSVDITNLFSKNIIIILIITLFLWPFTKAWVRIILIFISNKKNNLFNLFFEFISEIHLTMLKYKYYFNFSKKIHKISFIFWMFIIYHPGIYTEFPPNKGRNFIKLVSRRPYLAYIIPIISIILELILKKGTLYYSFYIFLIFLIIKICFQILTMFATSNWAYTCNLSDYLNHNWKNPKYPTSFWLYFNSLRLQFNQKPEISNFLEKEIQNHITMVELLEKKRKTS